MNYTLYYCPNCKGVKCMRDEGKTREIYCEICDRDLLFAKLNKGVQQ